MGRRKTTQDIVNEAENGDGGGTATIGDAPEAVEEAGEQKDLFPELDLTKPEEKECYLAAKAYRKAREQRSEILTTAKAKEDACRQRLVDAMGALKQIKWKHDGLRAEIIPGKAKVRVTAEEDEDEDDGDDEE